MNNKEIEEVINKFEIAKAYKMYKDIVLYGECVLDISESAYRDVLIKELIEVRKMLDRGFSDCEISYNHATLGGFIDE